MENGTLNPTYSPAYPCHQVVKEIWRGLGFLLTPMSHEDYSTHCAMASRATKGVVLKATNSHRVLRDHVRKDQLSVTRCTVHPSHSLAARPPIVASIEHFHPHPEVTRYGDELVVLIWLWREDLTMRPLRAYLLPAKKCYDAAEEARSDDVLILHR